MNGSEDVLKSDPSQSQSQTQSNSKHSDKSKKSFNNIDDYISFYSTMSHKYASDAQNMSDTRKEYVFSNRTINIVINSNIYRLINHILSSSKIIEELNVLKLWRIVYHPSIDSFRSQIHNPKSGNKGDLKNEKLKERMRTHLLNLKSELLQLQAYILNIWENESTNPSQDKAKFSHATKQLSLIYISIGDLCRYITIHCSQNEKDFSESKKYYQNALAISPSFGRIHNQLATIAHNEGNDFIAIYHYFRSLAVENIYDSATENLSLIFERNRQIDDKQKKDKNGKIRRFILEFIRVHGILFTKISVEILFSVQERVFKDFDLILKNQELSESQMLILFIINIFQIDQLGKKIIADPSTKSFSILYRHACNLLLKMATRLMKLTYYKDDIGFFTYYLASISIFLRYIEKHRDIFIQIEENVLNTSDNVSFLQYKETLNDFWNSLVSFFNAILTEVTDDNSKPSPVILPEDVELDGFLPLMGCSGSPTENISEIQINRIKRCLETAKKLANDKNLPIIFKNKRFNLKQSHQKKDRKSNKEKNSQLKKEKKKKNRKEKKEKKNVSKLDEQTSSEIKQDNTHPKTLENEISSNITKNIQQNDSSSMFINYQIFGKPLQEIDNEKVTQTKIEEVSEKAKELTNESTDKIVAPSTWKPTIPSQNVQWAPSQQQNSWNLPFCGNPFIQWGSQFNYLPNNYPNTWSVQNGWNNIFSEVNSQSQGTLFSNQNGNQT